MAEFAGSIWWLLVTLGVLVSLHELGHFWVGRAFGVKVLRFSVGFGKPVWLRRAKDGTEYAIGSIPLGGYVNFLQAADPAVQPIAPEDAQRTLESRPLWQRMLIYAAGPVVNLVLCVALLWAMLVVGRPDFAATVGRVDGLAMRAGFHSGDRLIAIDGEPTTAWNDALMALLRAGMAHRDVDVEVRAADGASLQRALPLSRLPAGLEESGTLQAIGLHAAHLALPPVVGEVRDGMPAAGVLKPGDRILRVGPTPIEDYAQVSAAVRAAGQGPVQVIYLRDGVEATARLNPVMQEGRPVIGIGPRLPARAPAPDTVVRLGPLAAVPAALRASRQLLGDTLGSLTRLATGRGHAGSVGGPVTIARVANASAHQGPAWFLRFLALMSLSLGVMNLLPIPPLDGGRLLLGVFEALKGAPLGERAVALGHAMGMALLLGLMGLAFYNDLLGLIG